MTQPSPADTLRAAADKLRSRVADLEDCRGPWYIVNEDQHPYPQTISNIGVPYVVASTTTDPSHPPTIAAYICTMHPGVGRAIADWLTVEMVHLENDNFPALHAHALAVARAILGDQP